MLCHLIKQMFGSQALSVVPLKSKDLVGIMKLQTEHFTDLFYTPSVFNKDINNLPQLDIIHVMLDIILL